MIRSLLAAGHRELLGALAGSMASAWGRCSAPGVRRTTRAKPNPTRPQATVVRLARARATWPRWFAHLLARLRSWQRRGRDRRELAGLDERLLRDIGLTRDDVARRGTPMTDVFPYPGQH